MNDSSRTSDDERAQEDRRIVDYVALLASAGLPLDQGLAALADDAPNRREGAWLAAVAARLARGEPPNDVLAFQVAGEPDHLRMLVRAGLQNGRLIELLARHGEQTRAIDDQRRRLRTALAYPLALMILLSLVVAYFLVALAPDMTSFIVDWDLDVPVSTQFLVWLSRTGVWVLLGLAAALLVAFLLLRLTGNLWIWHAARWRVPLFGPLWRWGAIGEWARLLGPLVELETPLPEALRCTTSGISDQMLARVCRQMPEQVAAGHAFFSIVEATHAFPASVGNWLEWGTEQNDLGAACQAIVELCEGNLKLRISLLEVVMPPLTLLFIGASALSLFNGLFAPLVSFINMLS